MWKADGGGGGGEAGRKYCFVDFCSLTLLYLSVGEGLWVGAKSLI